MIRYLTVYHQITKSITRPENTSSHLYLSLVIGTANSLYKFLRDSGQSQAKINKIIIDLWIESIHKIRDKVNALHTQINELEVNSDAEPLYIRLEVIEENDIADNLISLIEKLDVVLLALESLIGRRIEQEKYDKFAAYFSEKMTTIINFPHEKNPELNKRILNSTM